MRRVQIRGPVAGVLLSAQLGPDRAVFLQRGVIYPLPLSTLQSRPIAPGSSTCRSGFHFPAVPCQPPQIQCGAGETLR